ncbi:serine/threonine-protein kinase [Actinomadura physcomitrii]|uniref:serine/threonine-protein kinase n=1 Tax=Actinomadura physcomitrii TaxID=2650748 RepID=UPI00136E44DE|nr:serine/threonine-protein kinase [Actinomadura physcomitrii]
MRTGLRLADRYRLDALLGRGGMGEVWRGLDERLGRPVAVKILAEPAGADARLVSRFRREAEIMARLRHPGIVVVHDAGEDEHLLFLVMELLDGEDLSAVLKRHPQGLPVDRAVRLTEGIADALHAAHQRGVVHRDVKPANVMARPGDRVTVMDFGIARYADQVTELTGSAILGTPAYMAPEQFEKAHEPTPRTDLYALGGVLFALLTGRTPFNGDSLRALIREIVLSDPPRPREVRPDIPADLDELVHALLAKDPRDRPPDARAVAERLHAVAERLRAVAAPPPEARPPVPGQAPVPGAVLPPPAPPPPDLATRPVTEAPEKPAPPTVAVEQDSSISLRAWLLATAGIIAVVAGGWFLLENPTGRGVDDGRFSAPPACDRLPTPSIEGAEVSPTKSLPGTKDSVQCTFSVLPKNFADRGSITVELKRYGKKGRESGTDNAHAAMMSAGGGDSVSDIGDEGHFIDPSDPFATPQLMFRVDNLTADISIDDSENAQTGAKSEAAYARRLAAVLRRQPAR